MLSTKPMIPKGRPLIAIGYKYNAWKVLYFIVTDNVGITNTGIPYLSNYPEQFTNVAICPVAHPIVKSKTNLLLMRSTPTTNQDSLVWHWISYGLLSYQVLSYYTVHFCRSYVTIIQ